MAEKLMLMLLATLGVLFAGSGVAHSAAENNVSLRDYVDIRLNAIERATALALDANEKRLDGMNEFRATLNDQSKKFALQTDYLNLREDVQGLRETRAEMAGKASQQSVLISYLISAVAIFMNIATLYKDKKQKGGA